MKSKHSLPEIIQVNLIIFKRLLGIKKDVIVITDHAIWDLLFTSRSGGINRKDFGRAYTHNGYVFLNLERNETYKELMDTMIHELLHIKHPKYPESRIQKMTRKFVI